MSQSLFTLIFIRHIHRLREVSVQAMIEGSASARLGRTINTRTTLPAQRLTLQVGESVDIVRKPNTKDVSGWVGPAEVLEVSRARRGINTVRHLPRQIEVRVQDIRRHMHFLCLLAAPLWKPTVHENVWEHINQRAE